MLAEYGSTTATHPHPYFADWNGTRNSTEHYQKLLFVKRKKCVGTYCMRKNKCADVIEYGQPFCRFGFPLDFQCTWSILFNEIKGGGVRANFVSKRNDPLINQHKKMHLQRWMEICDPKIVLDEEQAIRYLVKYASKPERSSHHINDIMQPLLQNQTENDGEDAQEEEPKYEQHEPTDDPMGKTLTPKVAMKSVGICNKS